MDLRKWMERQTARDYRLTIAVEEPKKGEHKVAKAHYGRAPKQRTQKTEVELIEEIVREVVTEVMTQTRDQHSCETCPQRTKPTKGNKRAEDPKHFNFTLKPNGSIEYR